MKRIFLLAFVCLQALAMSADIVQGRVVDSKTNEPLEGAQVRVTRGEGNSWYIYDMTTDSCGVVTFDTGNFMCSVGMTINYFGYEELKMKDFMAMGGKDTLNLGDIRLKMSAELLKEVTVKGKAKQFYMKGDTVVFNPEAFNLEDGARMSELMKKLPGVRIEEGKITFNGKEVHLKMNGHDIADDFLAVQLPAEAVQNIKAYEKKSELAELTGMNDGKEQQVLDIVIKPGFLDKWYGQTTASAYASPHYRASANMHLLSEKNPIGIYGRISDNGSRTGSVWDSGEWDYDNAVPQRQQYGKLSYQHNWKVKNAESSYDEDHWSISTTPNHLDTHQNSWQNSETFLGGQPSSFSNSHNYNSYHGWEVPVRFGTAIHLAPMTFLHIDIDGGYNKGEDRTNADQQTYHADEYSDSPLSLVNSSKSESISHTEKGSFSTYMNLMHVWDNADFYVRLSTDNQHEKRNSDSRSDYDYHELGTIETLLQSANSKSDLFQTIFDTKINFQVLKEKLKVGIGYWIDYWHKKDNSDNYRNDSFDYANSYNRMKYYLVNEPRVEIEADLNKLWIGARVKIQNVEEHFDYQRGKLDTLVRRNTWFPRPSLDFKLKTSKTTELSGGAYWEYHVADLLDGLDYIDDTNPLLVIKGNPNLKANSDLRSNLSYRMMFAKGQQMLTWGLHYNRYFDPVASASAYNAQTGAYTTTKVNVDDRQNWYANVVYDRALGKFFRLRSGFSYSSTIDHGIKTMTAIDIPKEQFEQHVSGLQGNLRISFENAGWEVAATGSCRYNGVTYSDAGMSGQNLWDYRAGMDGRFKLKHWTFNLKGELVGNAGYLSDMMNRNRFSLNASITWKTLKNKGLLTLSAKDIINQMDQVYYNISPTMRNESRTESFHRYISLTFTYNFDAKTKKSK